MNLLPLCLDYNISNLNVTGSITAAGEPVGSAVYISTSNSTTQSIPTSANTALTFNTDTLVNWPTRGSPTVFTPPVPGTYLVQANCCWSNVGAGSGTTRLFIQKNSTTIAEQEWQGAINSITMHITAVAPMNGTTDTFTIYVYLSSGSSQTSGGAPDTGYPGNNVQIDRLHA